MTYTETNMATKEKTEEKKVEVKVREGRDTGLGNKRDGMRGGGERKLPKCVSVTRFVTVQTSITSAGTQRQLSGRLFPEESRLPYITVKKFRGTSPHRCILIFVAVSGGTISKFGTRDTVGRSGSPCDTIVTLPHSLFIRPQPAPRFSFRRDQEVGRSWEDFA
ncbi:hypothetical protein E2C01_021541 [Portunus trituberculatus]|uniref:Uncharacterized protein n=1 Tax=Portunus trituberculatus TaxID=210409 RepID=A0A5B7E4J0_PORTR|nr:hypothetical protein [Portunus trituberculatus]